MLLQTEGSQDSVTTLNLRLEKALQKKWDISNALDNINDKKMALEVECSNLTQTISNFNNLLDALNAQVMPLLPSATMLDKGQMPGLVDREIVKPMMKERAV